MLHLRTVIFRFGVTWQAILSVVGRSQYHLSCAWGGEDPASAEEGLLSDIFVLRIRRAHDE